MNNVNDSLNKILALVSIANEIEGRTKFQKIVFILKSKGVKFHETFKYHYYGPFSADLQLEIEELVDRNLLNEKTSLPYKYSLKQKHKIEDDSIKEKVDLIKFLCNQDYQNLELVSTIYFLQNNGFTDINLIEKKLRVLKPHLKNKIKKSFELKDEIDKY